MNTNKEWHWFLGGILTSLLSLLSYILYVYVAERNYPFGITSGFDFIVGKFALLFESLQDNPLVIKYNKKADAFVGIFILLGLVVGGYMASRTSGEFKVEHIPKEWEKYHGQSLMKRYIIVVIGGILLGYGAALAGGCTTGNILQGWAHLSLGSMVAGASFFITGIVAAKILYPKIGGEK